MASLPFRTVKRSINSCQVKIISTKNDGKSLIIHKFSRLCSWKRFLCFLKASKKLKKNIESAGSQNATKCFRDFLTHSTTNPSLTVYKLRFIAIIIPVHAFCTYLRNISYQTKLLEWQYLLLNQLTWISASYLFIIMRKTPGDIFITKFLHNFSLLCTKF